MNAETSFVIYYFKQHQEFLDAIKSLSFSDAVRYMKKNLDLEDDTELTQVQCNLFYAAIGNVEWYEVFDELTSVKAEKEVKT